jgi:hypothetical protein
MNCFKTCRVIVIDDRTEEALPIIRALSRLGMGCIYFPGDRADELPQFPLRGVEMVVLDMRLDVTGTSKQVAANTANVFSTIVSENNGPMLILLWTRHGDDLEAFKEALFATHPKFKGSILIADLKKPSKISAATTRKVSVSISALAKQWAPMDFIWAWEQMAHDAATETTSIISTHVSNLAGLLEEDSEDQRRTKWLTALKGFLRTLAFAAGGKDAPLESAESDLLETLAGLHHDQLEHMAASRASNDLQTHLNVKPIELNQEHKAELNGHLLLGNAPTKKDELRPGNAYIADETSQPKLRSVKVSWDDLGKEVLSNISANPEAKKFQADLVKYAADDQKVNELTKSLDAFRSKLLADCKRLFIEITPSCDFSQRAHRKRYVAKMAVGLLVPQTLERLINARSESLKLIEPVLIPGLSGIWIPVLSGRALFSVSMHPKSPMARTSFRLRSNLVTDLRNWYSARFARPGYLSV